MADSSQRIGDLLVARGLLDKVAADAIGAERARTQVRYASVAVKSGRVPEREALEALAVQLGTPAVDLARAVIAKEALAKVPLEIAYQNLLLPLRQEGSTLLVAMANPRDWQTIDEVSFATGLSVQAHVALHFRLVELIPQAHAATGKFYFGPEAKADSGDERGFLPVVVDSRTTAKEPPVFDLEVEVDAEGDDVIELEPLPEEGAAHQLILVVEDEPEIAKLVVNALKPLGHEVVTAERGLEALRIIKAKRPTLIVLDAMLPEVHGFEICRKVKESKRFGATPILMISAIYRGWRIAEDIKATYKVDQFLEKPFRVAELRRLAQHLLEQPRGGQPAEVALDAKAETHLGAAASAMEAADLDLAFRELRQAEALEPFSAKIQFLLGQVLERRDRVFQSIYHYERAVELMPSLFAATRALAMLYQGKGFKNKAVEMWERSLKAAPSPEIREQIKQYLVSLL